MFDSFDYYKDLMTEAFFPEIKVSGGGTGAITEFEKVMMTSMRFHRAYEYDTIALIFGVDRRRVGDCVRLYDWKFGEIGLYTSILDLQIDHDYVSIEEARRLGMPHSKISQDSEESGI